MAHSMADTGRYSWLVAVWKAVVLLTVSIGYWSDSLLDIFRADSTINNIINHIKEGDAILM